MKMLVAYDGTLQSKEALRFGIEKARRERARLSVLHIFNGNLFIDYGAGPGAADFARRQSAGYLEEAKEIIREEGSGVRASVFSGEGDPEEDILAFAESEGVDLLICTPRYRSIVKRYKAALKKQGKGGTEPVVFDGGTELAASAANAS